VSIPHHENATLREPFMVWCELFAPQAEKEPYSAFTQQIMRLGVAFEQAYTGTLGTASHVDFRGIDDGFAKTKELLAQGAPLIAGMPLVDDELALEGIPDVLFKKTTHKSVFGKFHYVVQEVKSSREVKEEHVLQATIYHLLLSRLQGYEPLQFSIVTRNEDGTAKETKFAFKEYEKKLMAAIHVIQTIMDGTLVPPPNVKNCEEPWIGSCLTKANEIDDISLVANVGTDKQTLLRQAGITTAARLAQARGPVEGIPDTKLEQLRKCAQAYKRGESFLLQPARLPDAATELYLDFEGVEVDGVKREYVVGILERTAGKDAFHSFVAKTPKEEGKMFKRALALLQQHPDAPIFHYAAYEKTAIKELVARYRLDPAIAKAITNRMTDLLQVCRRCVAPATSTFRLKEFGKALGATWREGMNAKESMALYEEFQQAQDENVLQKIVDYNEDDVRAMVVLKDWLVEQSRKFSQDKA
ncbi:MAG: TM0106 family RecB-like putative nuclease, partial [Nanoarchaeota archaeon]